MIIKRTKIQTYFIGYKIKYDNNLYDIFGNKIIDLDILSNNITLQDFISILLSSNKFNEDGIEIHKEDEMYKDIYKEYKLFYSKNDNKLKFKINDTNGLVTIDSGTIKDIKELYSSNIITKKGLDILIQIEKEIRSMI